MRVAAGLREREFLHSFPEALTKRYTYSDVSAGYGEFAAPSP